MDDNQEINENINSEEDNNIITRSFDPPPTHAITTFNADDDPGTL